METPRIENLDHAPESRPFSLGRVDLVRLGGLAFDRATFEPGWRWSAQASADESCQERHVGYLVSGRMHFLMDDGSELEAGAGDVYLIPPGHDAWVVGGQPCVALDINPE